MNNHTAIAPSLGEYPMISSVAALTDTRSGPMFSLVFNRAH